MIPYSIDIIILSYAKNDELKQLTIQAIDSLIKSEDPTIIHFNVVVIESNKALAPYQYEHSQTLYPDEKFGFHRYLNIGIRLTNSPYVCLCNNDLIFEKKWASEIIKEMEKDASLLSASPYCPIFHLNREFSSNQPPIVGYDNGILIGWCVFTKRAVFDLIGELDENLEFWYCDRDYANSLKANKIKHCLISSSFVTHLANKTLNEAKREQYDYLTQFQYLYFDYKWNHNSKIRLLLNSNLLKLKFAIKNKLYSLKKLVSTPDQALK